MLRLHLHANASIPRKVTYSDTNVPEPRQSDRFSRVKVVNDCLLRQTVGIGSSSSRLNRRARLAIEHTENKVESSNFKGNPLATRDKNYLHGGSGSSGGIPSLQIVPVENRLISRTGDG